MKQHSRPKKCPNCGGTGKVRWNKAYVYFVCSCGLNVSAQDFDELNRRLENVLVAKTHA